MLCDTLLVLACLLVELRNIIASLFLPPESLLFFFSLVPEDTLMFWKGIADVGLMEEVVCNIQKEIEEVLRGVQQRLGQSSLQITGG